MQKFENLLILGYQIISKLICQYDSNASVVIWVSRRPKDLKVSGFYDVVGLILIRSRFLNNYIECCCPYDHDFHNTHAWRVPTDARELMSNFIHSKNDFKNYILSKSYFSMSYVSQESKNSCLKNRHYPKDLITIT